MGCSASAGTRYFAATPPSIHSGLIRFFSNSFIRHSAGMLLCRLASEMDDWRMFRNSASWICVLHSAASKTRLYWASKEMSGVAWDVLQNGYGEESFSVMLLSGVAVGNRFLAYHFSKEMIWGKNGLYCLPMDYVRQLPSWESDEVMQSLL